MDNDTYIFIGNDTKIEKSILTKDNKFNWQTLIKANSQPLGFDIDITTCTLFYSTGTKNAAQRRGKICTINLINGSTGMILSGLGYPCQVAVNWISKKLFWCDYTLSTIEYSDFDGHNRQILLQNIAKIETIALDPCANDIYWISKETSYVISKMKLDGTNRQVIVSSSQEAQINSLVIDLTFSKLYWTEGSKIRTSDLDGGNRSTVYTTDAVRPTGIALYGNTLYWAEWKYKRISTCTTKGTNKTTFVDNMRKTAAIHIMDRSRQSRCCK